MNFRGKVIKLLAFSFTTAVVFILAAQKHLYTPRTYGGNVIVTTTAMTNAAKTTNTTIYGRQGTVVFILSKQRSGSSFLGQIFNRNKRAYYLYEPLYPFASDCVRYLEQKLRFLRLISHCDFRTLQRTYKRAFEVPGQRLSHHECVKQNLCFSRNHHNLYQRYANLCYAVDKNYGGTANMTVLKQAQRISSENVALSVAFSSAKACHFPLNVTLLSSICYSSDIVSFKILRLCQLSALEDVSRGLTEKGNRVYVVHLVRDPRAVINSALKLELKLSYLEPRVETMCSELRTNLDYADSVSSGQSGGLVSDGRYIRVRYEDMATEPIQQAERIYSFLGKALPSEVKNWIEETTLTTAKKIQEMKELISNKTLSNEEKEIMELKLSALIKRTKSPYGTVRDPSEVLRKWRENLSMQTIKQIQEKCGDVMKRLGYRLISSEEERTDLNTTLW